MYDSKEKRRLLILLNSSFVSIILQVLSIIMTEFRLKNLDGIPRKFPNGIPCYLIDGIPRKFPLFRRVISAEIETEFPRKTEIGNSVETLDLALPETISTKLYTNFDSNTVYESLV